MTDPTPPPSPPPLRPDPPSVRTILSVLEPGRRMTGKELRLLSGLPRRTVYQALRALRQRGVVLQRQSLQDTRQSYFWLAEAAAPEPAATRAFEDVARHPAEVSSP